MSSRTLDVKIFNVPSSALMISLALHLSIPFLFFTYHLLEVNGLLGFLKKKNEHREMYQSFIQVDVVALPDELINQKSAINTQLPIVDTAKPVSETIHGGGTKEEITLPDEKAKMETAAEAKAKKAKEETAEKTNKDKQRQTEQDKALKKLQEEAEREKALKSISTAKNGKVGRQKLSGNIISKGTAMTGAIGTSKDAYIGYLTQAIHDHYNIFPWQRKKMLANTLYIDLYPNGRVRSKKVIKTSGDPLFDSAVLQAVEEAQPLPLPADPSYIDGGINIVFKP
jgi:TonB family protein